MADQRHRLNDSLVIREGLDDSGIVMEFQDTAEQSEQGPLGVQVTLDEGVAAEFAQWVSSRGLAADGGETDRSIPWG